MFEFVFMFVYIVVFVFGCIRMYVFVCICIQVLVLICVFACLGLVCDLFVTYLDTTAIVLKSVRD